jgi:predicted MPP superfamily phosphohydrolase
VPQSSTLEQSPPLATPITVSPLPQWRAKLQSQCSAWARSPRAHQLLRALLLVGIPGIGAYAHLVEPTWLKVKRLTLPLHNLPPSLDGFRLVHLSDLHVGSAVPGWFFQRVIATVRQLAPDAIVLTGDFVHTRPESSQGLVALLSKLQAPQGVFAVLGNHDYAVNYPGHAGIPGAEEVVITALEQAGITLLRNEWLLIGGGRYPLVVVGIEDLWSGRTQTAFLQGIPSSSPRVLLSHNPDLVQFLPQDSFDLLLCGHTHGGQVRIPPFPPPVTATSNRRFWGGLFAHGHSWVFVSRGIGYTWRVRLAARPECVEITLTGQ